MNMVSVALCTYNGEKYIEEQLNSIISQTVPVDEIVICDDRSTDDTIKIVKQIKSTAPSSLEIRAYVNESNLGVTKNFEKALSLCNGDIIFLSDQDDVWDRKKVEKTCNVFEEENCLLTFTDAFLVDAKGSSLNQNLWELTKPILKDNYSSIDFVGSRYITGATVAIKRDLLAYTIPFPECWIHDAWLAINASVYGDIVYIDEKLISYRQHDNNEIGAKKRTIIDQIKYTSEHIDRSLAFRSIMKNRFIAFLERNKDAITKDEIKCLKECIVFWSDSEQIGNMPLLEGFDLVVSNLIKGKYRHYNHGLYGALVDFYIILSRKMQFLSTK